MPQDDTTKQDKPTEKEVWLCWRCNKKISTGAITCMSCIRNRAWRRKARKD